jgi:hypothetical protein
LVTGDFNNDGIADLAVGVPGESSAATIAGAVQVLYGSSGAGLPRDASEARWIGWGSLLRDLAANPKAYTPWFPRVVKTFEKVATSISSLP